ncbi:MAG: serine/threonine-protein kinase, partial [Myxococcota bacterium]
RDLKPENVFVAGGAYLADPCCVKVLDFGLAKVPMGEVLTVPGSVFGTPRYMSPEQAVPGRPVDRRTDIYSLGVILYELLCGDVPFPAVDAMQVMLAHVGKAPTPVAERRPDIPTPLAAVVDRCLDKRPAKRFATMAELRTALQRSIAGDVDGAPAIEVARASVMPRVDRTVIVDHGQLAVTVDELVEALPASADPAVASANGPPTMTVDGSPKDAGASIEGAAAAGASIEGATTAGASTAGAATGRGGRLPTPPGPEPWRPPLRADPWSAWVTLSCVVLVPVVAAAVYFGIV